MNQPAEECIYQTPFRETSLIFFPNSGPPASASLDGCAQEAELPIIRSHNALPSSH